MIHLLKNRLLFGRKFRVKNLWPKMHMFTDYNWWSGLELQASINVLPPDNESSPTEAPENQFELSRNLVRSHANIVLAHETASTMLASVEQYPVLGSSASGKKVSFATLSRLPNHHLVNSANQQAKVDV